MNEAILSCIHDPPCDKPARWYVWYEGCGGIYTYRCNKHLAESLLDDTVQIVQIDSIARTHEASKYYLSGMTARQRVCYKCQGRGVVSQIGTMLKAVCGDCGGSGTRP